MVVKLIGRAEFAPEDINTVSEQNCLVRATRWRWVHGQDDTPLVGFNVPSVKLIEDVSIHGIAIIMLTAKHKNFTSIYMRK